MRNLRALIVDDEALARERLRDLLSEEYDVDVIAECSSGVEALSVLENSAVDLLFLDIQMPGEDGFEVVAQLDPSAAPAVVFATAYDEFAVRAFEANAIDYLLKPIGRDRLRETLVRAKERACLPEGERFVVDTAALAVQGSEPRRRLAVRTASGSFIVIRTKDLVWMEAADNYVRLHTDKDSHLYRARMSDMEKLLDPSEFVRIHRSIIVSVDRVVSIEPWGFTEHLFVLSDGTKVRSSRTYREVVRMTFGC